VSGVPIRTPDQRVRVFVSSTLAELADERAAVRGEIERLHLAPVMFELGARPHPPRDLYRAYLEQSQIFVGIYWQRYGWVAPGETVSGLEDEYVLSHGMPRLLYVRTPAPQREPRLDQLLRRIQSDDTASYKPFRTPEELGRLVGADLALLLGERFTHPGMPTGVVTFLATEIDDRSTGRAPTIDDAADPLARLHDIVRRSITTNGGHVFESTEEVFRAAFAQPIDAVTAAHDLQRTLSKTESSDVGRPAVSVALHSGVAEPRDGGYVGPPLRRVAKLVAAAHGGQVLVSASVTELLGGALPPPLSLRSLGTHRLSDLTRAEEIHQLIMPGLPSDFPELETLDRRRHNLPVQLNSFVGRDQEVANAKQALARSRLVTLTGVGGSGKSRLAVQVAADVAHEFADGAWLVELAPLAQPERVPSAVADVLAIPEDPHRLVLEALVEALQPKNLLLIMDNCEHLLGASADLTARHC
jgi:class 3 adenylate cyclase